MKQIKSLGITLCLLLTTLFAFSSCSEDWYGDQFEGRWSSTYVSTDGTALTAIYNFDGNGYGTYTIYYANTPTIVERSSFSYEYNNSYLSLYYSSGSSDRFEYIFDSYNRLRLGYRDAYGLWVEEYYTRM